jgi:hypothetical protein
MKPSKALEKHISRDCIGHKQIGINVQRLLQRLRPNDNHSGVLPAGAKYPEHLMIKVLTINVCET